jgi:hypothetical protein
VADVIIKDYANYIKYKATGIYGSSTYKSTLIDQMNALINSVDNDQYDEPIKKTQVKDKNQDE